MKKNYLKIIILVAYTTGMLDFFIMMPLLGKLSEAYSSAGSQLTGMIFTISTLVSAPVMILSGKLAERVSKKTLLIAGNIVFLIGGFTGGLVDSIWALLSMRCIAGIGIGILMPLPMSLIAELFRGEERTSMVGMMNSAGEFFGILITLIAGYIAATNWHAAFYIYFYDIVTLLLIIVFLPRTPPEGRNEKARAIAHRTPLGLNTWVFLIFYYCVVVLLGAVIYLQLAVFIQSENIGDPSTAGIATAVLAIGIMLIGMVYNSVYRRLKRGTLVTGILLLAAGYLMLSFSHDFVTLILATALYAIGSGFMYPYGIVRIMDLAPRSETTFAISAANSLMGLAMFAASFFAPVAAGILGNDSPRLTFTAAALCLLISAVVSVIYGLTPGQRKLDSTIHERRESEKACSAEPC